MEISADRWTVLLCTVLDPPPLGWSSGVTRLIFSLLRHFFIYNITLWEMSRLDQHFAMNSNTNVVLELFLVQSEMKELSQLFLSCFQLFLLSLNTEKWTWSLVTTQTQRFLLGSTVLHSLFATSLALVMVQFMIDDVEITVLEQQLQKKDL